MAAQLSFSRIPATGAALLWRVPRQGFVPGGGLRHVGNHVARGPGALREAKVEARGGGTHVGQLPSRRGGLGRGGAVAARPVLSSGSGPQTSCPTAASRQAWGEGWREEGAGGGRCRRAAIPPRSRWSLGSKLPLPHRLPGLAV